MTLARIAATLGLMAALSACGGTPVTRNVPYEALPPVAQLEAPEGYRQASVTTDTIEGQAVPDRPAALAPVQISTYSIKIPQELTVSEANLYHPMSDIVWREDPRGNRKAQVGAILQEAMERSRGTLKGGQEVQVDLTLRRFHSLSEKARYTIGGMQTIFFDLRVSDVKTGAVVMDRLVKVNFKGFGGRKALDAEAQGITQRKRILHHVSRAITAELTLPGGWNDQDNKLDTALGQI
ncbi:DUF6778 family protein [Tropicibacter naphthalenivorans]|uniref:Lipoprotein n=1 Tax=Tropicibacter naphthalenivorans TaxID=441103 RepID=A0A0N7LZG0_9RHOB|nr:DUF6778 family protein [Tropicibacter naphthalenivorans]CUH77561.1 hypothetical protein TRN7648_01540 [Tropicibacter naphthalenivorans]SMC56385.1 hypothetical protein SAMN04488093_10277 [Tropicibacter naphthalenivorans]